MTYKMDELYERIEALSPLQSTLFKLRLEQEGVDFYSELETAPAVERLPLIERTEKKDHYTLAPVQKRLFLLSNMESGGTLYNLPLVMLLKFEPDLRRLNEVFETVIRRHEAFRTSFHWLEEEAVMRVHGDVDFQLQCLELQREPVLQVVTDVDENAVHQINETLANFSRPVDLAVP
ncbi:MAG: hypothetical protein GY757_04865, partial [bacterium]|nr:hypothetical protein [bacterium]